jgi:hypothetical protein
LRLRLTFLLGAAVLAGCGGDDITFAPEAGPPPGPDGAAPKDATVDVSTRDVTRDAPKDTTTEAETGPPPQRVIVTTNNSKTSELVAVNVGTKAVDGRLTFPGDLGTTDAHSHAYPFLLEQASSTVARLSSAYPWTIEATWNVLLADGVDGGYPYVDPIAVIVAGPDNAYVLRYDRNAIAVIKPSQEDAGLPPTGTIDLSSLVQSADQDGIVEMTEGVFIPSMNMVFVVLENIDEYAVSADGEYLYCADTVSTVIGIDTTTNALVNLGGTGPGGSIALQGYNPVPNGLVYDISNQRLILFEEGCYAEPTGDAGAGPRSLGGVEAVSLADFSTSILLDIDTTFTPPAGYPSGIITVDPDHYVLGFDFTGSEVYDWNPSHTKLGPKVPNAPDIFTYDGAGNLLGTVTTYDDAGAGTVSVVSVAIGTGNSTTLAVNPFTIPGGFIGGVDVWPHP